MKAIRQTKMLDGAELKSWTDEKGCTHYVLPDSEPDWDRVEHVSVLKEDTDGKPIWWSSPGINKIHFGAVSKEQALDLHESLTGKRYSIDCEYWNTGIYESENGITTFSLHR